MAKPVPEGLHTVTPHLIVRGGAAAIEFYKRAFGAVEISRMPGPGGGLMHAEIQIGDSRLFLVDEAPSMGARSPLAFGGSPVTMHLYLDNVDAAFARAVSAGAKVQMPVTDMFWGDRFGQVSDPFGHVWSIATHKEDVPPEEMGKRAQAAMAAMAPPPSKPAAPARKPTAGKAPARAKAKTKAKARKSGGKKKR